MPRAPQSTTQGATGGISPSNAPGVWHRFTPPSHSVARAAAAGNAAVCEIVYQVDDGVQGPRGYRYVFYGNGFFISKDGYLLTAAHVLSQLRGGSPSLLLHDAAGQPHFVQANLVAMDHDHDVAILRATPNPFAGNDAVSFLPLDAEAPGQGEMVRAESVSPAYPHDSQSLDPVIPDRSPGDVLRYEFSQLYKGAADSELFLFDHTIQPGQSGAPVLEGKLNAVTGLVEGQWLRDDSSVATELKDEPTSSPTAGGTTSAGSAAEAALVPGAAVPIHYAIALLQQKGIAWQPAPPSGSSAVDAKPAVTTGESSAESGVQSDLVEPLSLVPARYPADALFGGEVVLDAAVDGDGLLSDVKLVHGDQPFALKALDAVKTWAFVPDEKAESRITIVFQFPQPYVPPRASTMHHYEDSPGDDEALPLTTTEPVYPAGSDEAGSVILYELIDRDGHVASARALRGDEALSAAAIEAARDWEFSPARLAGAPAEAAAIVVVTFRHPLETN